MGSKPQTWRVSVDPDGKGVLPATAPPVPSFGSWVRGFGSGMTINDQVSRSFDQNIGGFQFGADKRLAVFNGDLYVGGFLGYLYASRDFLDGSNGSSNEISVGAYSTWVNPQGWYSDLVFKYSQLWNYLNAPGSNGGVSTGSYTIASVGGSLEIGKRFDLGSFFIEPQAIEECELRIHTMPQRDVTKFMRKDRCKRSFVRKHIN